MSSLTVSVVLQSVSQMHGREQTCLYLYLAMSSQESNYMYG